MRNTDERRAMNSMLGCWYYARERLDQLSFCIKSISDGTGICFYGEYPGGVAQCVLTPIADSDPVQFMGRIYAEPYDAIIKVSPAWGGKLYVQTRMLDWNETEQKEYWLALPPVMAYPSYESFQQVWEPHLSPIHRVLHAIRLVRIRRLLDATQLWKEVSTEIDLWIQVSRAKEESQKDIHTSFQYMIQQLYVAIGMSQVSPVIENGHQYYMKLHATVGRLKDELLPGSMTWLLPHQEALLTLLEAVTPDDQPPNMVYDRGMNTQTGSYLLCKDCNQWLRYEYQWDKHKLCREHKRLAKTNYFCKPTAFMRGEPLSYALWDV